MAGTAKQAITQLQAAIRQIGTEIEKGAYAEACAACCRGFEFHGAREMYGMETGAERKVEIEYLDEIPGVCITPPIYKIHDCDALYLRYVELDASNRIDLPNEVYPPRISTFHTMFDFQNREVNYDRL